MIKILPRTFFPLLAVFCLFTGCHFHSKETATFRYPDLPGKEEKTVRSEKDWDEFRQKVITGMEAVMGPLPDRSALPPLDIRVLDTLKTSGYYRLDIRFTAAENEIVPAYLYIPTGRTDNSRLPAMVALQPTGELGKKIVDGQGKENRGYAKELAERGYVVIAPDYPGYGDLSQYDFKADRYQSGTMKGIFNHMRCVDLLQSMAEVDPGRIGVIGHSLGGHNAVFLGSFDERLQVVVSSCGWTKMSYYDIEVIIGKHFEGRFGCWAQEVYMPLIRDKFNLDLDLFPFDFDQIVSSIAPRPFFSNSPLHDTDFYVEGVKASMPMIQAAYRFRGAESAVEVRYPDAGHDFPDEERFASYRFIDNALGHVPNRL